MAQQPTPDGTEPETDTEPDAPKRRVTAELTDDGVLPPEILVTGSVPTDLTEATEAAIDEHPNALDDPRLTAADQHSQAKPHHVALFTARYNELPVTGDDGELLDWLAPYRAREHITEALIEHCPEHITFEAKNESTLVFYEM